jgi:acyl-CoA thioester hydrolase
VTADFRHRVDVRYLEVDRQGVVFNMWYLAYLDDAMTGYLRERGIAYEQLIADGLEVQLVHTDIDWSGAVRWQDDVWIEVRTATVGTTSFSLGFVITVAGRPVCRARTVYVLVADDGSGKRPLSAAHRAALTG